MASFWDNLGPGLLQTGGNFLLGRLQGRETADQLRKMRGPLYDQQQALAGQSLALAGGMDPTAMAADRFAKQQALVAPGNEADRLALMRSLQAKGMLGTASYAPVAGTASTPGVAMNPQMAALLAAQEGAKQQASYGALKEGQDYLDQLVNRGGMLQRQAQGAQRAGIDAGNMIPRKPGIGSTLLQGGMNALKDPKVLSAALAQLKNIPGLFGSKGPSWDFGEFDMSRNTPDFSDWL